ncbi:MAG TPA: UDP-N-acetylmuramate--L-alanine ligase [Pirellulales bacterium]|nr:UDP-N-acetylmuramate--L-alanine ligase [Pirellulales bacterium]
MYLALQAARSLPPWLLPAARRSAYLIGIAGSGMSALAEVLADQGWRVTGSDLAPQQAKWLWTKGIRVFRGHAAEQVDRQASVVVYSDAVGGDNVERRRAGELGIRQLSYPQMLGEVMKGRLGLAVAGTHGKSTTTALAAQILVEAGLDPTVVGGGVPLEHTSGGRQGQGRHMLVEACEYRRNFLHLCPQWAAITGIERDHFDCFPSTSDVVAAFAEFARRLPASGALLVNAACPLACTAAAEARCRVSTFGVELEADWSARRLRQEAGRFTFELASATGRTEDICLRIPGRHNVLNAVAAAALAGHIGAPGEAVSRGLSRFAGLRRRLEHVGRWRGALWYDDYGHHPTQVRAALTTLRQMFPRRRLWCIFQPHQKLRTERLLDEFAASLQNADRVAVAAVYPAREIADAACGQLAAELAARTRWLGTDVIEGHIPDTLGEEIGGAIAPGDVIVTLGAGDIRNVWHGIEGRVRSYRAAG